MDSGVCPAYGYRRSLLRRADASVLFILLLADVLGNEIYGDNSGINYHAADNTLYGSHSLISLSANTNIGACP